MISTNYPFWWTNKYFGDAIKGNPVKFALSHAGFIPRDNFSGEVELVLCQENGHRLCIDQVKILGSSLPSRG